MNREGRRRSTTTKVRAALVTRPEEKSDPPNIRPPRLQLSRTRDLAATTVRNTFVSKQSKQKINRYPPFVLPDYLILAGPRLGNGSVP